MIFSFFEIELKRILKSSAFYIFFFILFFIAFQDASNDVQGRTILTRFGQSWHNSPIFISQLMAFLSVIGVLFTMVLIGPSVSKDFDHKIHDFFFTAPISKFSYLFGRFSAGLTCNLLLFLAIISGSILGWISVDPKFTGPISFQPFFISIFVLVIPNVLFIASVFFALASLTRNMFYTYMAGVGFILIYFIVSSSLTPSDESIIKILLDPTAISYLDLRSATWTVSEINKNSIPVDNLLIWNRFIWILASITIFSFTYFRFKLHTHLETKMKINKNARADTVENYDVYFLGKLKPVKLDYSVGYTIKKCIMIAWSYATQVIKNPAFLIITFLGVRQAYHNFVVNAGPNGSNVYPFTSFYLDRVDDIFVYMIPITIIFGGLLVWRERDNRINEIYDSLPLANWVSYLSKFLALAFVQFFYVITAFICGVLAQILIFDFYSIEPLLYFKRLIGIDFINYLHMAVMVIFIQNLVPNKYLGFLLSALYYIGTLSIVSTFSLSSLLNYGFLPTYSYSNITGFGSSVSILVWYRIYWFLFSLLLMIVTSLLWRQNIETALSSRFKIAKHLFNRRMIKFSVSIAILFLIVTSFIYYNNHSLNLHLSADVLLENRANYEKLYKQYDSQPKPSISHIDLKTDFYPESRSIALKGSYMLINKSDHPIEQISFTLSNYRISKMNRFSLEQQNKLLINDNKLGFYLFDLFKTMGVGDTVKLEFDFEFRADGFSETNPKPELAENGSYIHNFPYLPPNFFPSVGYNQFVEIISNEVRKEYSLAEKRLIADLDNKLAIQGTITDLITYEAVLSTDSKQTAVTNGNLLNKWQENDRNFFHYKTDVPINNALVLISGKYEIRTDSLDAVKIEIFYDERHEYNIDRMIKGIKRSLTYCSENFGKYPFKNVRIVEATINGYPGNGTATSQPTIFTWQEFGGFISNLEDSTAIDVVFNTTTHEMAHQWWGHMVRPALVEGLGVMTESLSQWVRIKTFEQEYGIEKTRRFLESEMDKYLRARRRDLSGERPMIRALNQSYLNYRKGSIVMYALGKFIGESAVNKSLKTIVEKFANKDLFPTTRDLLSAIRLNTPDSLQYLITDLFEKIIIYDNKIASANYKKLSTQDYEIDLIVESKKLSADSIGNETEVGIYDYIPILIFGHDKTILYNRIHKLTANSSLIKIRVNDEPISAGIDPFSVLIDRNPANNLMNFR